MKVPNKVENVVNAFTKTHEHILWQFPGYLTIKDSKSQYFALNKNFAKLWEFYSLNEVVGIMMIT